MRKTFTAAAVTAALGAAVMLPVAAPAQQVGGSHILGLGELQPAPPRAVNQAPPAPPAPAIAATTGSFMLRRVVIEGRSSVPPAVLATAWQQQLGRRVDGKALSAVAFKVGKLEAAADIALYIVSFPHQDPDTGTVHISITEASVAHVVIDKRTKNARLGLIEAYVKPILQSRPLKRSVLERYVLLMGDIAGGKVGSAFVPVRNHPDQTELVLTVQQNKFFGGFTLNNQGTPALDATQIVANAGVNNLLREGERTQLIVGLPVTIKQYHYFGINDIEPIGTDGMTLALSAGQLVSHVDDGRIDGNAQIYSAILSDPVIRGVHTNVSTSLGLDVLNSSDAFLGFTASDERTRAVRAAVSYNDDKYLNGINTAVLTASQGVGILGARAAGPAYGGPNFFKGNISLQRLQALPGGFALRLSGIGQFTENRLPPSEEFDYGGPEYGKAFSAAELTGDEGIAGLAELAHTLPAAWLPTPLAGTALFVLTDYGEVWNRHTIYAPATDRAASFAFGMKLRLLGKVDVSLGAATPVIKPEYYGPNQHWRFVLATAGTF